MQRSRQWNRLAFGLSVQIQHALPVTDHTVAIMNLATDSCHIRTTDQVQLNLSHNFQNAPI
jgi:hypothetical protein